MAFLFGTAAQRLKLPPLVGYLLAGIAVGPFTPGFVVDTDITLQLADIGVVLLMFGVGLHFAPRDLLAVKAVALVLPERLPPDGGDCALLGDRRRANGSAGPGAKSLMFGLCTVGGFDRAWCCGRCRTAA